MPEETHDVNKYHHSAMPDGSELFNGNAVTYTEISSLQNVDFFGGLIRNPPRNVSKRFETLSRVF